MDKSSQVFRFTVIRSAEATPTDKSLSIPSVKDLGGVKKAKALADETEKTFLGITPREFPIEEIAGNNPLNTLSAILKYGKNSELVNRIVNSMGSLMTPISDNKKVLVIEDNPKTKPYFGPVGIGELRVVEQHLIGYEAGDIAHIENVLASELRERKHKHVTEEEIFEAIEEEQTQSMEQNLQTAERLELSTAARDEINSRSSLEAGLSISARYGPSIEVDSSLNYSRENAKQSARERASSYAQEITEQAVSRTESSVKTKREVRRRNEVTQKNTHSFDNSAADSKNIVGIYQYINKHYKMKLVNRGKRLLYEFILPSPGAFLRELGKPDLQSELQLPRRPNLNINSITSENYTNLLRIHANTLTGLPVPPTTKIVAVEPFQDRDKGGSSSNSDTKGSQRFLEQGSIPIEAGYFASSANVSIIAWSQHEINPIMELVIGKQSEKFDGNSNAASNMRRDDPKNPFTMNDLGDQTGSIGYSFFARHDASVQVVIELVCEPTPELVLDWKHKIYDAVMDDYKTKLSEYKSALAEEKSVSSYTNDFASSPQSLRELEHNELKRLCLQLFGQETDLADPLNEGGVPFVMEKDEAPLEEGDDLIDVEKMTPFSRELRFAEQAFEWTNLTYTLYPYYWNDAADWKELLHLKHQDSEHATFLRAGAARVLVPVRENWHRKVHSVLVHGAKALDFIDEINVTSPLWLPLWQEIEESQNPSSQNRVVEKCWDVKVPTNLVMLKEDSELPTFDTPDDCPPST
ncbi:MAG: hypothetical protein ACRBCS_15680 [Cellvibrionaceae bacterium]